MRICLAVLALCNCGKSRLDGDIDLRLGDCAPPTASFVAGPRAMAKPSTGALPLASVRDALVECFRLQSRRWGVAVLDLTSTRVTAHGIDSSAFTDCVANIVLSVPSPLRCPVAFGRATAAEWRGIDITPDSTKFAGDDVHDLPALADKVKAARDSSTPLALRGPLVIRVEPGVSMTVVNRVVDAMLRAGEDPVVAVGPPWTLPAPLVLPPVPVAIGQGAPWSMYSPADNETVRLSVYAQSDQTWVGLSRVNEFQPILEPAKLADTLKTHKQSAFFADRADIELAVDDDLPAGKLADLIHTATAAGFTDWQVRQPRQLSARPQL